MRPSRIILVLTLLASLPALATDADAPSALLAAGRVDDAISTLRGQIAASPKNAEAHNLLCRAYYTLEEWDRGIENCEQAIALEPDNSLYHLWLGRIYGEKADSSSFLTAAGLAKKVRTEFEKAVQLNPGSVDARTDLAEFYFEAPGIVGGGRDKAAVQAQALATLDPVKSSWVNGRIAEKKKDMVTAEKEYRAAITSSQGSGEAWLNLALFYRHVGRLDDMEDAINHAASAQATQPMVLMDAADTLIRAGRNFPGAVQLLKRYLSGAPVEEAPAFRAHYLLGTVLEKQGDKLAAAQEYRAALALAKDFSRAREALNRLTR